MTAFLFVAAVLAASDFEPLFDGETFEGWEGNFEMFRIEDGAIVGGRLDERIPHNDFLCTTEEYADFELRLQVKLTGENPNGGIQLRSRRVPDHHEVSGYQADMGGIYWGALYDESRRNKVLIGPSNETIDGIVKQDDWNDYVIRCEGRQIQLWLNGVQTVDYTEADGTIPQRGHICVQIHSGPPAEAWYRNIRIKILDDGSREGAETQSD